MSPSNTPDDIPRLHSRIEPPFRSPDPEWDDTAPYSERPPYRIDGSAPPPAPLPEQRGSPWTILLLMGNVVGITALVVKTYFCACG